MPDVDHALTLPRHDEQSRSYRPSSIECKSVKTTSGKCMKLNPSTSKTQTDKEKEVSKITDFPFDLSPQAESKDRKIKLTSTSQNDRKACKLRPTSLISPCTTCKKHGQHPEHENSVSKQKSLHICTSCSSNEVIEVNIKLKSCQNCQNVSIDEINYDNQPVEGNEIEVEKSKVSNASTSGTSGASGLNFYHQQLTMISKKIKNMYKNRIHSSHGDEHQPSQSHNNGSLQSTAPKPIESSPIDKISDALTSPCSTSTNAASSRRPVRIVTPQNPSSKFNNSVHTNTNHCYSNNLPTDDSSEYSTSKISSISILPLKSNSNNSNVINKDALILRICDLDDKLKSMRNESKVSDPNGDPQKLSTDVSKHVVKINQKSPTPILVSQPNTRKIVIISEEYKRKSEKNDVYIRDRKEIIKRFQQNKSKSLDLLPPSKCSEKPTMQDVQALFSQSVTNLSKQASIDGSSGQKYDIDDDDGPYESINSVELIFISDEFLNKAVKHDLKILKGKQTSTKSGPNRPSSLKKNMKTRKLEASTSPIKMLKPDDCHSDSQQSPSSVSPENVQTSSKKHMSNRPSSTSSKKLIVISEDFKRKSLENNVVIVDNCTNDSTVLNEVADKRKTFQQTRKLSRQQSSIDDVANHMVSHAFRSFEEPDEQCLESKEIKTPE